MATFALAGNTVFPAGTLVGVYPGGSVPGGHTGQPLATVITTAVATSSGVTFNGLEDATLYIAAAEVSGAWRFSQFRTDPATESPTATQAELDELRDELEAYADAVAAGGVLIDSAELEGPSNEVAGTTPLDITGAVIDVPVDPRPYLLVLSADYMTYDDSTGLRTLTLWRWDGTNNVVMQTEECEDALLRKPVCRIQLMPAPVAPIQYQLRMSVNGGAGNAFIVAGAGATDLSFGKALFAAIRV